MGSDATPGMGGHTALACLLSRELRVPGPYPWPGPGLHLLPLLEAMFSLTHAVCATKVKWGIKAII